MKSISVAFGACLALLPFAAGCQPPRSSPGAESSGLFPIARPHQVQMAPYRIDPPDEITIHCPRVKEVDGHKEIVGPDGTINLNLLGQVNVAGMTVAEVSAKLNKLAGAFYDHPDIKIQVKANSKFYYVTGTSVTSPGKKPYTGHDTVISALADAGFTEAAWPQKVSLSRPSADGQPHRIIIDFTKITDWGDMRQNYMIEEGDIIHVYDSPLHVINTKVSELVGPLTGASVVADEATPAPGH